MSKDRHTVAWSGLLIAIAFSVASFHSALAAEVPASVEAREAPIRALHGQIIAAYNRGDAAVASAGFAPDGSLITGDATRFTTPQEIERYLSRLLAQLPKGTQFIATVTDIRFSGPDIAVLTSEGGWLFPGESKISDKNQGIQTLVAVRHKGNWRAVLFQRTRRPVPAPSRAEDSGS
jgi:uncharacterized protein (TIGR02246 family)